MNIIEAMEDEKLFGRHFTGATWDPWRAFLTALFALPMNAVLARELVEGLELLASVDMDFGVEQRRYVLDTVLDVRYLALTPEMVEHISLCDRHINTSQ